MVNAILRNARLNQCGNANIRFAPNRAPRAPHLLAAFLGSLLMVFSVFAGELRSADPSVEEQARRSLEKASKEEPWQNSLGMKFVPVAGTQGAIQHSVYVAARFPIAQLWPELSF